LGLCREEDRGSLEDLALLLEPLHAPAQFAQLVALGAREPVIALVTIELVLLDPDVQRLIAAPETLSDVFNRTAGADELDRFTAKLRWIRPSCSWHGGHPFVS